MVDGGRQLRAVEREVRTAERAGRPTRIVVVRQVYLAEPGDLWDALTNPFRLPRWFLPVSGDLQVGGRYQLEGNAGGEILTCDKPSVLAVTWEYGDVTSWVTVRLAPVSGGGSTLELQHEALLDQHWTEFGPGAVGVGWDMALFGLDTHLRSGAGVEPKAAEAWFASTAGVAFLTAVSQDWGRASMAAGEDPEAARAAAARTTAAYTGESGG